MSNSQRTLLIVATSLALLGAAALFLLDRGPGSAAALPGASRAALAPAVAPPPSLEPQTDPSAEQQRATARQELVEATPDDPFAAARCGFRGRLLLPTLEPAPGLEVRLFRFGMEMFPRSELIPERIEPASIDVDAGRATSGEDGRFLVTGVWPRGVYVLAAGAGSDTPLWQLVDRTPGPGEIIDLGDLVLQAMGTITGTVVDDAGEPLPGALVRAADLPGEILAFAPIERFDPSGALIVRDGGKGHVFFMPPWVEQRYRDLPIPSTFTDADGAFTLKGVVPGTNVLVVTSLGFRGQVEPGIEVRAGETRDVGEIELDLGELIQGLVVDTAGEPVAGAQVLLAEGLGPIPVELAGPPLTADRAGRFSRSGLAGRSVTGAARRTEGDAWTVFPQEFVSRELKLTLPATHTLTVRLVSSQGLAIERPRLRLVQRPDNAGQRETLEMATLGLVTDLDVSRRQRTTEDGRIVLPDLATGRYLLLAQCDGHAVTAKEIDLEGEREETLTLEAARAVLVRVLDGEDQPVANAEVLAAPSGSGDHLRHGPLPCGRTRPDGTLLVTQVQSEEISITVRHPLYGSAQERVNVNQGEAVIVLAAPGSLEGVLTDGGQIPELGKWMLAITGRGMGEVMPVFTVPDLEGRFRVQGLQPGDYRINSFPAIGGLNSVGGLLGSMRQSIELGQGTQESFEIRSGERTLLIMDATTKPPITGPAANVSGLVLVDGFPGTGLRIGGWAMVPSDDGDNDWRRFAAEVDVAGRFDLGRVPAGSIRLSLTDPNGSRGLFAPESQDLWSETLQIVDKEDRELRVELVTGSLVGTVLDVDGAPAVGCRVTLRGAATQSAMTDERGRFSISMLAAGSYGVEARGARGGRAELGGVEVAASRTPTSVDLRLQRTFTVRGRVEMAAFGERPQWLWMSVTSVEDEGQPRRRRNSGSQVSTEGLFTVEGLLPGRYTASFFLPGRQQWTIERPFEVRNADLDDLILRPIRRETTPSNG